MGGEADSVRVLAKTRMSTPMVPSTGRLASCSMPDPVSVHASVLALCCGRTDSSVRLDMALLDPTDRLQ